MERRKAERISRRLTCELVIAGRRHPGVVLDLSPYGLFVQTSASPPPGEAVLVRLRHSDGCYVEVEASVARRNMVPRRLASVASTGIGLRVESGTEDYRKLIDSALALEEATDPPPVGASLPSPIPEGSSYRVRARQIEGVRSRTLHVSAESAEQARATVSASLEEGWEIFAVDRLPS